MENSKSILLKILGTLMIIAAIIIIYRGFRKKTKRIMYIGAGVAVGIIGFIIIKRQRAVQSADIETRNISGVGLSAPIPMLRGGSPVIVDDFAGKRQMSPGLLPQWDVYLN